MTTQCSPKKSSDKIRGCVVDAFAKSGVSFVVSNGINIQSGCFEGRDLDIFVDGKDYKRLVQTAKSELEANSYTVGIHWKSHTAWLFAFGSDGEIFEIDFFHYQQWHFYRFITSPSDLDDIIFLNGLPFSPYAWLVKNILIQSLSGNFKKVESKILQLRLMLNLYPELIKTVSCFFGSSASNALLSLAANCNREKMEEFSSLLKNICFSLTMKSPKSMALSVITMTRWFQKILEHKVLCRKMCPIIALVGVDGAGKSSVIQSLQNELPQAFPFWKIISRHWRPELLPLLSSFSSAPPPVQIGLPVIPRTKPGRLGALRSVYYCMDFVFGYFFLDRPVTTNIQALIYDRHFGDMVIDPTRFGISNSRLLACLSWIIPKPDILIFLHVSPELARLRKGELSDSQVIQINSKWLKLGPKFGKEFHVIDASLPISKISNLITNLYISKIKWTLLK